MRNKMIGVAATRFNFLRMQLSIKQSNDNQLLEKRRRGNTPWKYMNSP